MKYYLLISLFNLVLGINSIAQYPGKLTDIKLQCQVPCDTSIIVIRDNIDIRNKTSCRSFDFDFTSYDIIGINTTTGGCSLPDIDFEVIKDIDTQVYQINGTIHTYGSCRRMNPCKRFVFIEKMDPKFDVHCTITKVFHMHKNSATK